jgi:hypothetical protein
MAKKFRDLVAAKPPAWHAAVRGKAAALRAELPLHQLRHARTLSQQQLADELDMTQPEVSKLEHRTDLYVSTLRRYIEAMGGALEITARFPDGRVLRVGRFGDLDDRR